MAAKRTLGWISALTLASLAAGCAGQTPSMTAPEAQLPNLGPAIIQGDTLIVPATALSVQGGQEAVAETRFSAKDFANLPSRIEAAGGAAPQELVPAPTLASQYPGAFAAGFPGLWGGNWAGMGAYNYCASPFGFAYGTPGVFPKTFFLHPDVYYLRRNALYFPYSRLGGYFYPVSVPYGAQFYTPLLAYGFGGLSAYTFTSGTCPVGMPFPGALPGGAPVGPGVGPVDGACAGGDCAGGAVVGQYGHGQRHMGQVRREVRQEVRQNIRQTVRQNLPQRRY